MPNDDDQGENESASSLQRIVGDVTTLIRQEVELAKTELSEKAKSAGVGAAMLSVSAVSGLVTLGCLTAVVALALTLVLPSWAAMLVVTLLWAGVTAALALFGKRKVESAVPFVPEQTIKNIKEDVAWARRRGEQPRT